MTPPTLTRLRELLQWAIEIEHSTLPPYFCALYSIKAGYNQDASKILTSVLMEEMLHMVLAANVLNAVGGAPELDKPGFLHPYPATLPHSSNKLLVHLAPFSPEAVETFMEIEKPEETEADPGAESFSSIGQFYRAIQDSIIILWKGRREQELFCGDPSRQITAGMLDYGGSGRIVPVIDLASALEAIAQIGEQGEGFNKASVWDGHGNMFNRMRAEVAHYFRFNEVRQGRRYRRGDTPESGPSGSRIPVDWTAVHPMRVDPRMEDFPEGSLVRTRMEEFNRLYGDLLRALHRSFNGEQEQLNDAIGIMYELKDKARDLMQMSSGDGVTNAGPSFEYVPRNVPSQEEPKGFTITVQENGPYIVDGGIPLVRKSIVHSEWREPLTWRKESSIPTGEMYRLCRCGQSANKPFCDSSHERIGFNGRETALTDPSADRRMSLEGERITVTDDQQLCIHASFCIHREDSVWDLLERSADSGARFKLMQMVERCPSGRLGYEVDTGPLEPDLPKAIAVTKNGPYWVTGGISIRLSDGRMLEQRNRVTLCRCGKSSMKPLCDGTHKAIRFREG